MSFIISTSTDKEIQNYCSEKATNNDDFIHCYHEHKRKIKSDKDEYEIKNKIDLEKYGTPKKSFFGRLMGKGGKSKKSRKSKRSTRKTRKTNKSKKSRK